MLSIMKNSAIVFAIAVIMSLLSCKSENSVPEVQKVAVKTRKTIDPKDAEKIVRIHGAHTGGSTFVPGIAKQWLHSKGATDISLVMGETTEDRYVVGHLNSKDVAVQVESYGSRTGFHDLAWQKCDIALSSKPINEENVSKLRKLGNMRSGECEFVVALDGIVIIVNKQVPILDLEIADLKKIYSGEITNWSQLGQPAGEIKVFRRDNNSGTHEVMKREVFGSSEVTPRAMICLNGSEMSEKVLATPGAIGYVSVSTMSKNRAVTLMENGVASIATPFTLQTEEYPLTRPIYMYKPEQSSNPYVNDFVEFTLTHVAQKEVEKYGFVPQTLKLLKPSKTHAVTAKYAEATENALRLSTNFHFLIGSSNLDSRSEHDLKRVADFIKKEGLGECDIMLFGFSDNMGEFATNKRISYQRARSVGDQLESLGISVSTVRGYGPLMPIATNATPEGRGKNRRVEMWIRCGS